MKVEARREWLDMTHVRVRDGRGRGAAVDSRCHFIATSAAGVEKEGCSEEIVSRRHWGLGKVKREREWEFNIVLWGWVEWVFFCGVEDGGNPTKGCELPQGKVVFRILGGRE